jgi:HD-like signal output (HDOD) protein
MNTLSTSVGNSKETLDLLWARVRQRGDLPGFSKVVSSILTAMRGEDDREFNMTKTVLADPALTQKVLRLANSSMYAIFGNGINTVSKAVIVLGTEAIGHLALGLKLIDGLSAASPDTVNARSEMEKALLAGHIARHVTSFASTRDAEEAVVCSMLHSLGRMMVSFYLADRWALVQTRCEQDDIDEESAAHEVLGLDLSEIGRVTAARWGLPASLVESLQNVKPVPVGEPLDHADWLAAVSTMSSECANVLHEDSASVDEQIATIAGGYADMLGLDVAQVMNAVDAAQQTAEQEAVFVRPSKQAEALKNTILGTGKRANSAQLLANGVKDLRDASSSISTGQLLTMALETVYQGLGLTRAIVFLRDYDEARYAARLCFGDGAQELMPRLAFGDAYQPDVFHAALANDKMIFVANAHDNSFVNKLPRWWKDTLPGVQSFVVLPLTANRHPVGFIYGDWDHSLPPVKLDPADISPLNELRILVVRTADQWRKLDFT